jgi:hypothetical protein
LFRCFEEILLASLSDYRRQSRSQHPDLSGQRRSKGSVDAEAQKQRSTWNVFSGVNISVAVMAMLS